MLIDWFTVAAQALNFLVLVWLLRRFLYQPILTAIDAREKRIADELADAAAKQSDAKLEREEFEKKNAEFDQQRTSLLSKATEDAAAEKERLLGEARDAADAMSAKRLEALHKDAKNLNAAITRRTQDEVFSIARKVLTDLTDADLEERAVVVFTGRLRAMDDKEKSGFNDALKSSAEPALLRSAFDLTDERREEIRDAIHETFASDLPLQFEIDPDLVSGIELTVSGNKVAWSIADYLKSLEKGVGELLNARPAPQPKSE
jgi:F-type H+-transporting ATPase subunit b